VRWYAAELAHRGGERTSLVPPPASRDIRAVKLASLATSALALALIACGDPIAGAPSAASSVGAKTSAPPAPPPSESAFDAEEPADCGGLECRTFDTPEAAFAAVLDDKPLILAIGETHAQKGSEAIASVTARFTSALLPELEHQASALLLELWVADGSCGKAKEKAVEKQQKEVVKTQASGNQNEFVALGEKSKSLGVIPFILRPTCAEYDKIQRAGDDAVLEMLTAITTNMEKRATKLFDENRKKSPEKMIVTYGGAMHTDLVPAAGREQWSFAKSLDELSGHKYVELDLVVPEFVGTSDTWKSMPWYAAWTKAGACSGPAKARKKTILYATSPRAYALIFPCTP
jgi:hypothetical protein